MTRRVRQRRIAPLALKPETLALMYTPATLNDGTKTSYGLGWMIDTDQKGRVWISHSGGATGGTTYLLRDPKRRLAVAILCNVESAPGLRELAVQVADSVQDESAKTPVASPR